MCRDFKNGRTSVHDEERCGRPHTAAKTQEKTQDFDWKHFNHSPYGPDLAPSDYFLFLHFKKLLDGQRYENDKELKNAIENWFNSQAVSLYAEGLRKLMQRFEKCERRFVEK